MCTCIGFRTQGRCPLGSHHSTLPCALLSNTCHWQPREVGPWFLLPTCTWECAEKAWSAACLQLASYHHTHTAAEVVRRVEGPECQLCHTWRWRTRGPRGTLPSAGCNPTSWRALWLVGKDISFCCHFPLMLCVTICHCQVWVWVPHKEGWYCCYDLSHVVSWPTPLLGQRTMPRAHSCYGCQCGRIHPVAELPSTVPSQSPLSK